MEVGSHASTEGTVSECGSAQLRFRDWVPTIVDVSSGIAKRYPCCAQ